MDDKEWATKSANPLEKKVFFFEFLQTTILLFGGRLLSKPGEGEFFLQTTLFSKKLPLPQLDGDN